MKLKATLILLALIIFTFGLVFALLYGVNRQTKTTEAPLPTDQAAQAYATQHQLLQTVTTIESIRLGGPTFKFLQGNDVQGNEKIVWLAGRDKHIKEYGSILLKDAVPKETILQKAAAKGVPESEIVDIFIAPYDYTSGKIVWFVRNKDIKKYMLFFDAKTGELIWEAYEDPTAWTLRD